MNLPFYTMSSKVSSDNNGVAAAQLAFFRRRRSVQFPVIDAQGPVDPNPVVEDTSFERSREVMTRRRSHEIAYQTLCEACAIADRLTKFLEEQEDDKQ